LKYSFILLPIKGTSRGTTNALHQEASAAFRVALTTAMSEIHALNQFFVLGMQWKISIPKPQTSMLMIMRSPTYGKTSGVSGGPTMPPVVKQSASAPIQVDNCWTGQDPCDCAALSTCSWVRNQNTGISTCTQGLHGVRVPCSACPLQLHCDKVSSDCTKVLSPCTCASWGGNCRWDVAKNSCMNGKGTGTSCVSCARQAMCAAAVPKIATSKPISGTYMRTRDTQRIVFGFDKVIYMEAGVKAKTSFLCVGQPIPVEVSRSRIQVSGNTLVLEVRGLMQIPALCKLVIDEGLVIDSYGVPFLGLAAGQYSVDFGDFVAPRVLAISPKNGETQVEPKAVVVTFTFSEKIVLTPVAEHLKLILSRLEDGETLSSVSSLELKPPSVRVLNRQLMVDLKGKIEAGVHYTLSLPSGAVADLEQNAFGGLASRMYAFNTAPKTRLSNKSAKTSELPLTALIGLGSAIAAVFFIGFLAICSLKMSQRKHKRQMLPPVSKQRPASVDTSDRPSSHSTSATPPMPPSTSPVHVVHPDDLHSPSSTPGAIDPDEMQGPSSSTPMGEVPMHAFSTEKTSVDELLSPSAKRAEAWAPKSPSVSPNSRHNSERASARSQGSVKVDNDVASKKWQQHAEAKRRWHTAFLKASAKKASELPAGGRQSTSTFASDAGESSDAAHAPSDTDSPEMPGPRPAGDASQEPRSQDSSSPTRSASAFTSGRPTQLDGEDDELPGSPTQPGKSANNQPSTRSSSNGPAGETRPSSKESASKQDHAHQNPSSQTDSPTAEARKSRQDADRQNPSTPSGRKSGAAQDASSEARKSRPDADQGSNPSSPSGRKSGAGQDASSEARKSRPDAGQGSNPSSPNARKSGAAQDASAEARKSRPDAGQGSNPSSPSGRKSGAAQDASSEARKSRPDAGQGSNPSSPSGRKSGAAQDASSEARKSRPDAGQGSNPSSPTDGAKSGGCKPPPLTEEALELQKLTKEVERRMRELLNSPIAERKKFMRELMLEYHPDKNSSVFANEICQFINASRSWFLLET